MDGMSDAEIDLAEAWSQISTCDGINLDQPLGRVIVDLQRSRDSAKAKIIRLEAQLDRVRNIRLPDIVGMIGPGETKAACYASGMIRLFEELRAALAPNEER